VALRRICATRFPLQEPHRDCSLHVTAPPVPFEAPGQMASSHRCTAKLRYEGKPFASVPIELSAVEAGSAERHDKIVSTALTLVGLPESDAVPCMTLPWQVAQKVHACTDGPEPLRTNDRAHDLVDLQLLEALLPSEQLADTRAACIAVFQARAKHPWPPRVVAHPHWGPIYVRALEGLEELGLAPTVTEAVERVQAFADRIDGGSDT
jgi:hypothetical protein